MATILKDIGSGLDEASISDWEANIAGTDDEIGTLMERADLSGGSAITFSAGAGHTYLLTADASVRPRSPTYYECQNAARSNQAYTVSSAGFEFEEHANFRNAASTFNASCTLNRMLWRRNLTFSSGTGVTVNVVNTVLLGELLTTILLVSNSGTTVNLYHCSVIGNSASNGLLVISSGTLNCYACVTVNQAAGSCYDSSAGGDENVSSDTSSSIFTTNWQSENPFLFESTTSLEKDLTLLPGKRASFAVSDYTGSVDTGTDWYGTARAAGSRHAGAIQPPATPPNTLLDNLVDWWQGDEGSAASNMSSDTGNIDLVQSSSPAVADGIASGGRAFDGAADYFQEATHSADLAGDQEFYFAGWFRTEDTTGTQALAGQENSASGGTSSWGVKLNGNTPELRLYDGSASDGPNWNENWIADHWNFVEVGYDPATDEAFICVNRGTDVTSSMASTGTIQEGSEKMTVMSFAQGAAYAQGWICAAGFWNAIPSTADRDALFNTRHGLDYADFAASSATFTASIAATIGGAAAAASTTFDPGTFTASVAAAPGGAAAAASATHTAPTYTASVAATTGGAAAAATATSGPPTYTASVAATTGGAAAAASATFDPGTFTASAASTVGGAAGAASATHTPPTYTASAALTTGGAAAAATAAYAASIHTATVTSTTGGAAAAASATFDAGTFTATAAATVGGAAAAASATSSPPTFTATVVLTTGGAAAAATATLTIPGLAGPAIRPGARGGTRLGEQGGTMLGAHGGTRLARRIRP